MRRYVLPLLLLIALATTAKAQPLRGCVAEANMPPFSYNERPNGFPKGFSVELLTQITKIAELPNASLEMLPWKRCLAMVASGKLDFVMNVPTAQIDPAPYLITQPYYDVWHYYVYAHNNWPQGIAINNLEDLKRYKLCGLLGYNFDGFGIDTATVDTGATTLDQLMAKLQAKRCDLVIEKREVFESLAQTDPGLRSLVARNVLRWNKLPEDSPLGLHFAVSRLIPKAREVADGINKAIIQLKKQKTIDPLMDGFLPKERRLPPL